MAKKDSERVMKARRKNTDRISFVIDKNGKYLLHAQALREGVSVAEMIRRAILDRCGLSSLPDFSDPHYQNVINVTDKETADAAIAGLQMDDRAHAAANTNKRRGTDGMTVYFASETMKREYLATMIELIGALKDTPPGETKEIDFNKKKLAIIRRLLSNILPVYPDD